MAIDLPLYLLDEREEREKVDLALGLLTAMLTRYRDLNAYSGHGHKSMPTAIERSPYLQWPRPWLHAYNSHIYGSMPAAIERSPGL